MVKSLAMVRAADPLLAGWAAADASGLPSRICVVKWVLWLTTLIWPQHAWKRAGCLETPPPTYYFLLFKYTI
jgi:hypothetical protein